MDTNARRSPVTPPPFWEGDGITIYHGDCREILPTLAPVDCVITDPPYSERTHEGQRSAGASESNIGFGSITSEDLRSILASMRFRRWLVSFMDYRMVPSLEDNPPAGMRGVRMGVWVKPNGAPQFTGDRPAQGWEAIWIAHAHREKGVRMKWNGGGNRAVWTCPIEQGPHPTQKPLRLVRELVELFSDPGDTILDPFMGSGTTLVAARDLGRKAIGIELEERYCEIAVKRLSQRLLPLTPARKEGGE